MKSQLAKLRPFFTAESATTRMAAYTILFTTIFLAFWFASLFGSLSHLGELTLSSFKFLGSMPIPILLSDGPMVFEIVDASIWNQLAFCLLGSIGPAIMFSIASSHKKKITGLGGVLFFLYVLLSLGLAVTRWSSMFPDP